MASTKTSWILELIDKVTKPLKSVDKTSDKLDSTLRKVTASIDDMDDTTKETAKQAIKSFRDLKAEIRREEKQVNDLNKRLKDLGDTIDPLKKAEIDLDIQSALTKIRRYKEQLAEVTHELREIEKAPNPNKIKENLGAAVVIANQTVELVNKAIDGMSFTTEIEDLRAKMQRMSGESGDELDSLVSKAYNLGAVFKENPEEIAKAANAMTKMLGGTYDQNLALIEAGYEKGANINGDLIDQLKEYPTFIRQIGLSQSQSIALMAKAGQKGIFSDKAFDSIKEADLSLKEMGNAQVEALKGIGIEVKDLAGKTTFEAVQMISKAMKGANTQAKQLVLADIFKGAGEDAGLAWIEGLDSIDLDINNIPSVEAAGSGIKGWLANLRSSFSNTFGAIGSSVVALAPVVTGIASIIPLIKVLKTTTYGQAIATKVATAAQWLWNAALTANPIGIIIVAVGALVAGIVWLTSKVEGWGDAWKHTWEGAKLLFSAFIETSKAHFNLMIQGLMIGINKIKEGWYKFKIAMGIGDKTENQKMLNDINADTEARKKSIVDGYKKVAELSVQAANEFKLGAGSLKIKKEEGKEEDLNISSNPGDFTNKLDGKIPSKNPGGGSGLTGSGKAIAKTVTMNLTINNHFKVAEAASAKIDKIADMVTGKINDRLRDALISI